MVTQGITASVATPALKMLKFAIPEKDYINGSYILWSSLIRSIVYNCQQSYVLSRLFSTESPHTYFIKILHFLYVAPYFFERGDYQIRQEMDSIVQCVSVLLKLIMYVLVTTLTSLESKKCNEIPDRWVRRRCRLQCGRR